jgi:hypothetical protein
VDQTNLEVELDGMDGVTAEAGEILEKIHVAGLHHRHSPPGE